MESPNNPLQQTGHAKEATARHSGFFRVSRQLSLVFGQGGASVAERCPIVPAGTYPLVSAMFAYDLAGAGTHWPGSVIAADAVVYACGAAALPGDRPPHDHDPAELDRCRRLADASARRIAGESLPRSTADSPLFPFFITAAGGLLAEGVTPDDIRRAFRGVLYPPVPIRVEPLREDEAWWEDVVQKYRAKPGSPPARVEAGELGIRRWRGLIRWFAERPKLAAPSFVSIGWERLPDWDGRPNPGVCFPRLIVGRTQAGSLVGVGGVVVQA